MTPEYSKLLLSLLLLGVLLTADGFSLRPSPRYIRTRIDMALSSPKSNADAMKIRALKTMKVLPVLALLPLASRAGLFTTEEQDRIDDLCGYQRPINDLADQLKPTMVPNAVGVYSMTTQLKGGKEDSDAVRVYMEVYIKPVQKKMEELAPKIKLDDTTAQERLNVLPALMKGHILELTQAIESISGPDQLKEVEEVQETLAEFLKLSASKYSVKPFIPSRPLTDAELFGPLGCEFWGKARAVGSNNCVDRPAEVGK
jgi:hypothetical protein